MKCTLFGRQYIGLYRLPFENSELVSRIALADVDTFSFPIRERNSRNKVGSICLGFCGQKYVGFCTVSGRSFVMMLLTAHLNRLIGHWLLRYFSVGPWSSLRHLLISIKLLYLTTFKLYYRIIYVDIIPCLSHAKLDLVLCPVYQIVWMVFISDFIWIAHVLPLVSSFNAFPWTNFVICKTELEQFYMFCGVLVSISNNLCTLQTI